VEKELTGRETEPWEIGSRRLLKCMSHKCLLLFSRKEFERACDRVQKQVGIVQVGPRQEIRADHLQTITTGFVAPEHQSRSLDCLLNHRDLALVQLEVNGIGAKNPRLRLRPEFYEDVRRQVLHRDGWRCQSLRHHVES